MTKRTKAEDTDRRFKRRFCIAQALRYNLLRGDDTKKTGIGRTLNISSSGVWFTTECALNVGALVELSMNWPARLNDVCPIKLMIYGRIVRSDSNVSALTIERYEFRTQASAPLLSYEAPLPLYEDLPVRRSKVTSLVL